MCLAAKRQAVRHKSKKGMVINMNKKNTFSIVKAVVVGVIGLALAVISYMAIMTIIDVFSLKEKQPYLYGSYTPNRQLIIISVCIVVFVLIVIFNVCVKRKWLTALVNTIVIIALCNPITFFVSLFWIPTITNYYTIESEADFNLCADDMVIDFTNFPRYSEFVEQDVRFVGKVEYDFFFYQSITAIVKYDDPEQCEADYNAYVDSHRFLTEPVIAEDGDYLIAAPEFHHEGIFFKVVTDGEDDRFPKKIYMIGIDRESSTLYCLYLHDLDLDIVATSDAQDLEDEMRSLVAYYFNLGK